MSVDRRIALIAARQHSLFTTTQALRAGATKRMIAHRVATGRWERPYPRVLRIAGAPETFEARVLAACFAADAIPSHTSAGVLWQLDGVDTKVVEVSAARRVQILGLRAFQLHDLCARDITRIGVIPVTSPSRTIVDLAGVLERSRLETALDDALRRGLVTPARLSEAYERLYRRGRAGIGNLRVLLDARRTLAHVPDSVLEERMRRLLLKSGLPEPVLHHRVAVAGRTVAVVDLAYLRERVAIELDGYRYHHGRRQWQTDLARQNTLITLGWRVLRYTNEDVERRPNETTASVASALSRPGDPSQ